MPINKAVLAAFRAATLLKPDIKKTYKAQRVAGDVTARLAIRDPRCRVEDAVAVMKDGYEVPLRIFTPLDITLSLTTGLDVSEYSHGTILFFHGGGWVIGSVDSYFDVCNDMAIRLGRRVISVDYRRAPEYRFPQAPEDCYEVARQLYTGELLPRINPSTMVMFGDSAGGNLAAVVSLMAHDRKEFTPSAQMLLYPSTFYDHTPFSLFESIRENGHDYLLSSEEIQGYMDLYLASPEDALNPYFAPILASDLSDQPRTLVITAEYCPLRDEGEFYAIELEEAGCEVECYRMLDAVHGYLMYPSVFNIVKDTYRIIKHFLDGEELEQEGEVAWLEILGTD